MVVYYIIFLYVPSSLVNLNIRTSLYLSFFSNYMYQLYNVHVMYFLFIKELNVLPSHLQGFVNGKGTDSEDYSRYTSRHPTEINSDGNDGKIVHTSTLFNTFLL